MSATTVSETMIEIGRLDSPIGEVEVAVRDGRVCLLKFEQGWDRAQASLERRFPGAGSRPSEDPAGAVSAMERYFGGDLSALDGIEVDVDGTPFQERVWDALCDVPAGATTSYASIAEDIGSPRAVRAVGSAVGANPVGIVIPCHRIVRTGGGLGGYGGGIERKVWLLDHERRHA
jgi:methylated-DNA-[protein]-cysteine S-methyltransferase